MSQTTKSNQNRQQTQQQQAPAESNLPVINPPRLPWHPGIKQQYGIDQGQWRSLVSAIYPNAETTESVILALSYCKSRNLDVMKRPVHIVAIWSTAENRMIESVWPGIGELRTTAHRTGSYAGKDETLFGDDIDVEVGSLSMTFPEWAQVTVYRIVQGQRVPFTGPKVYWLETYANKKRGDATPNQMWADRPRGQIEKCAEAAALRAAFPEEIGYCGEELERASKAVVPAAPQAPPKQTLDGLSDAYGSGNPPPKPQPQHQQQTQSQEPEQQQQQSQGESTSEPQAGQQQQSVTQPTGDAGKLDPQHPLKGLEQMIQVAGSSIVDINKARAIYTGDGSDDEFHAMANRLCDEAIAAVKSKRGERSNGS